MGGDCHQGSGSVPVDISGCVHWFGFAGGHCRHCVSKASVATGATGEGQRGTAVPVLVGAASAPWRPSRAGAGDASHSVVPWTLGFGGGSPPHLVWGPDGIGRTWSWCTFGPLTRPECWAVGRGECNTGPGGSRSPAVPVVRGMCVCVGGGGRNNQHNPQYANDWAPLTRKRHIPPHPAQPQHTNDWAPRTRKRHQREHRPQRPTERNDPTQHAKGRTGDCPGPRKGATTRRNVTRGVSIGLLASS